MAAPLLVTTGLMRYEAVLHGCGTNPVEGGGGAYILATSKVTPGWVSSYDSAYP